MKINTLLAIAAIACFAIISFGCGSSATNTAANSKSTNSTAANKTTSNTSATTTTAAPADTETAKADSTSPNTGVPECDEYITKYEACLTTIAAKAPQAAPGLKTSFEAQRDAFKKGASTPEGKAVLAPQCKAAISNAKTATAAWCTNW